MASLVAQVVKVPVCNAGNPGLTPLVGKIPWRRKWQPTPGLLPGKFHGWRNLIGYSPWGHTRGQTRLKQLSMHARNQGENLFKESYFPGGSDSKVPAAMWETRVRSLSQEDLLEKTMATHSSTLAWKIPWMEEPGRPQSMGSQRVGHG